MSKSKPTKKGKNGSKAVKKAKTAKKSKTANTKKTPKQVNSKLLLIGGVVGGLMVVGLLLFLLFWPLKPSYSVNYGTNQTKGNKVYISRLHEKNKAVVAVEAKEPVVGFNKVKEFSVVAYIDGKKVASAQTENREATLEFDLKGKKEGSYELVTRLYSQYDEDKLCAEQTNMLEIDSVTPYFKSIKPSQGKSGGYSKTKDGTRLQKVYRNTKDIQADMELNEEASIELKCSEKNTKVSCDPTNIFSDTTSFSHTFGEGTEDYKAEDYTVTLDYTLTDKAGNERRYEMRFVYDTKKPKLTVKSSKQITTSQSDSYILLIKSNENLSSVKVGKKYGIYNWKTKYYEIKNLKPKKGTNKYKVEAVDYAGNKTTKTVKVKVVSPTSTSSRFIYYCLPGRPCYIRIF